MNYVPNRSVPVIVQNRDVLEAIAGMTRAVGTVVFGANATTTKVIVICGVTFEFLADVSTVAGDNTPVLIGVNAEDTRDNLITALGTLTEPVIGTPLLTVEASGTDTILLTYWCPGSVGNITITDDDANVTHTGLIGGFDGGAASPGYTAVPMAAITAGEAWANTALPADTDFLFINTNEECYLVPQIGTGTPAQNGFTFTADHPLFCKNCDYLAAKRVTSDATGTCTAFVRVT